jgi:Abnormal spindle-like microcephaly-assoc'd, ASPM-SPD-2-Hydin
MHCSRYQLWDYCVFGVSPRTPSFMKVLPTDAPAAALSRALLSFPAQEVGSASPPQPLTIVDLGSAALTVSNGTASGDFSSQNNCGTVSPAGGTCAIQVTFTPTATGTRNGTLTITDNSAGSSRTVELTGQGAIPTLTAVPVRFRTACLSGARRWALPARHRPWP